jgi:uncharacterized membrane protein YoaK (UPF0700 family)
MLIIQTIIQTVILTVAAFLGAFAAILCDRLGVATSHPVLPFLIAPVVLFLLIALQLWTSGRNKK